jgi:hypothetical protein
MPSPLPGGWLWPGSRSARAASGPRDPTVNFDRLFEEERRRRRTRSQSSRRGERPLHQQPAGGGPHLKKEEAGRREAGGGGARETAGSVREEVLRVVPPERRPLPGRSEPLGPAERLQVGLDCDEVLPGLLLASGRTVKALAYMHEIGVTHVINTASRDVWLPAEKLSNMGVELFQFHVDDVPSANIAPYFRPAADLVRRAEQAGGRLVVNCLVGFSRSATLLAAALMQLRHWTAARALSALRRRRQVKPNLGFMAQLLALEVRLREQGIRLS